MLIDRPADLARLARWRDQDVIKVVTGVRRCGKSSLLALFRDRLRAEGVSDDAIVAVNLEDPEQLARTPDHLSLYREVVGRLATGTTTYVFIDEVQEVDQFERAVDGLHLRDDVDLYVTGSNAHLLSGELATLLSGRYVEIGLLPLSFVDYVRARRPGLDDDPTLRQGLLASLFADFVRFGAFPYVTRLQPDIDLVRDYLTGILNTALLKDVVARRKIARADTLRDVVAFMLDNVANLTTTKKIADTLTSSGRRVAPETVAGYLTGLTDSYVLYEARRYDIRGKRLLENTAKYYAVDTGLRTAVLGDRPRDDGHLLENVVYLELRRRFAEVYVGKLGPTEVDFIAHDPIDRSPVYIQVAHTVTDPHVLARELATLTAVPAHYPRLLLTADLGTVDHDGIRQTCVYDWLLDG
ncbi:MAG: ATP-binding protein [Micrococcales bacterium]|nr:ATP-binding protein [Micrococcales bacterium]